MRKRKWCRFLIMMALITNVLGFIPLFLKYQFKDDLSRFPYNEYYDMAMVVSILLAFYLYVFGARCLVRYKNQLGIFTWIGVLGPMGLFGAILLPNRRKYLGLYKIEDTSPRKGFARLVPKLFRSKKYKYITEEEKLKLEAQSEPQIQIENIDAETIEVKTTDGRIIYLKTVDPDEVKHSDEAHEAEHGDENKTEEQHGETHKDESTSGDRNQDGEHENAGHEEHTESNGSDHDMKNKHNDDQDKSEHGSHDSSQPKHH